MAGLRLKTIAAMTNVFLVNAIDFGAVAGPWCDGS
jgi:hypothetical protein